VVLVGMGSGVCGLGWVGGVACWLFCVRVGWLWLVAGVLYGVRVVL